MSCNSVFGKWSWITITCVNFNQMILERNWMLSKVVEFINVANTAFAFCECWRNVFKKMFMCKLSIARRMPVIFHIPIFAVFYLCVRSFFSISD